MSEGSARWPRRRLLNVWVDDLSMNDLFAELSRSGGVVFTINPDHLFHLQRNPEFLRAYRAADFITVDSHYVRLAQRWVGRPVHHRLPGSDIVPAFCAQFRADPATRVFLLGAKPGVARRAMERINAEAGRTMVVGAHGPSMNFVQDEAEIDAVLKMIDDSGATVLFVGLGAPKQEIWLVKARARLPKVKILMGIGATIDYEAGEVRRAPEWLRRIGLEWAFRVFTEPRRYLLRYLRNTEFFWWVLLDRFGLYRDPMVGREARSP
jgi:N-acetylglucosaminyldiphosphoundecaprenol N-acetyl-beta-D-mannosaminyltransferase